MMCCPGAWARFQHREVAYRIAAVHLGQGRARAEVDAERCGVRGRRVAGLREAEVVAGADDATFARPSPCAPWTVAELVYHVRMTMGRLPGMLTAPEPAGSGLVPAAAYYRADQRFSATTNAERIQSAQRGALDVCVQPVCRVVVDKLRPA